MGQKWDEVLFVTHNSERIVGIDINAQLIKKVLCR